MDGYFSYVNLDFLEACLQLRILVLVLSSYFTYCLQSLDVNLFASLAQYYTNEFNVMMYQSHGFVAIIKRLFWYILWSAWQQAFCEKNIFSAYRVTGIFPYDLTLVLGKIKRPVISTTTFNKSLCLEAPLTLREV